MTSVIIIIGSRTSSKRQGHCADGPPQGLSGFELDRVLVTHLLLSQRSLRKRVSRRQPKALSLCEAEQESEQAPMLR
jgi:hypothetical protein